MGHDLYFTPKKIVDNFQMWEVEGLAAFYNIY